MDPATAQFLKSLGFPDIRIHSSFNHFDFKRAGRRILVIGPMGSGKTEYSSRVWRDSRVARNKSNAVAAMTSQGEADRRRVFFIRSSLDRQRFPDYPDDALAYRGGYERCGPDIASIRNSFQLEELLGRHPEIGTWIIDEAAFYEERLAYVVEKASRRQGCIFIFPTLVLNFRREIFNSTARLLLDLATDIFPLTAYCEHQDCMEDSFYTYRFYRVGGEECPALYFDPLIIIGGDRTKEDPREPNYCTRCDRHHYLPGKEYSFLVLKPLAEKAAAGSLEPLEAELRMLKDDPQRSLLQKMLEEQVQEPGGKDPILLNALKVPALAERALLFLFGEQNLLSQDQLKALVARLRLDEDYLRRRLEDNGRSLNP